MMRRKHINYLRFGFSKEPEIIRDMKSDREELPLHKTMEDKSLVEIDLETALELCGAGKYQVFHCGLMVAVLGSVILEMIGCSFILPAAACDLELSDNLRGILTSVPNIGIILTAPFWGRAADALGRKPVLLFTTAASGVFALLAAFMPNLLSFTFCKFASSLFLSCPSSLGFAYAGELMPRKRRDLALLICNALLMLTSSLCPIFAWGILSHDWTTSAIFVKPWRILTALYATPVILAALWLTQAKESPKFLMTKNKQEEALEVLKHIFVANTGYDKNNYCESAPALSFVSKLFNNVRVRVKVTSLKSCVEDNEPNLLNDHKSSAWSLLKPPHLKWLALTGFLMFGLFSLLNGLFLFAPSTINKVVTSDEPHAICELMNQPHNKTSSTTCTDHISYGTFKITVVTSLVYGTIVMLVSLSPLSKKTLLVCMFSIVGVFCVLSVLTTNRLAAGVSMSALQITALGIGPLTAYSVQIFPTALRATAVGAVLMLGRVGSVFGANAAGVFLAGSCTATFYGFSGLLFLCAFLSVLLP